MLKIRQSATKYLGNKIKAQRLDKVCFILNKVEISTSAEHIFNI